MPTEGNPGGLNKRECMLRPKPFRNSFRAPCKEEDFPTREEFYCTLSIVTYMTNVRYGE